MTGKATSFASLKPFRHRDFSLVWSAALVSNVGNWMQTVAVGALVTEMTGRATWTGLVAAAAFLPIGVLAPIGGALADRIDRRKFLIWIIGAESVFAVLLAAIVASGGSPEMISLMVFAGGCMASLGLPAFLAILPDLVDENEIFAAMSLGSAQYNFGRVVGPALAGVIISIASYTWAFVLNALSFFCVVAALILVRHRWPPPENEKASIWSSIVEGGRAARTEPGCRAAILTISVVALTASPFIALMPAVAQVLFGQGPAVTSLFVTAQGVGAVLGALALPTLAEKFGRGRLLVANLGALCVSLVVYALAPDYRWAAAALILVGALYIGILSGLMTVVQLRAPGQVRARVLSLYMVALGVVYPVGATIQGRLADTFGLRTVTVAGAVALAGLLGLKWMADPASPRVFDDPESGTTDFRREGVTVVEGRGDDGER